MMKLQRLYKELSKNTKSYWGVGVLAAAAAVGPGLAWSLPPPLMETNLQFDSKRLNELKLLEFR